MSVTTHSSGALRRHARHALPCAALFALAACSPARAAQDDGSFVVVSGSTTVRGGEEVCFDLARTDFDTDRLAVRIRFTSAVPRGWIEVDGVRSASFEERSEEFTYLVAPRGTHQLRLELQDQATIDWLSVTSSQTSLSQVSCSTYEWTSARRVTAEQPPAAQDVNRFETGRTTPPPPPPLPPPAPTSPAPTVARGDIAYGATIPAGTSMEMALETQVSSGSAYVGQAFDSRLTAPVIVNGQTVLPTGTRVIGHVVQAQKAGRFGRAELKLGFDRAVLADGTEVPMQATVQRIGKGSAAKQGGIIAGSAVGGAILGKVLGGDDKDALLGAIVGGSIAAGSIGAKAGEEVVLPPGTVMAVALDSTAYVPWEPRR